MVLIFKAISRARALLTPFCQSGRSAGLLAALLAIAFSIPSGAETAGWAHQAAGFQSNGAVTIKSLSGGSYAGTQNPTGTVARSNQIAVTQPPTVLLNGSIPCFLGIDQAQIGTYCKMYSQVQRSLFDKTVIGIYMGNLGGNNPNIVVDVKDLATRAWGCYNNAFAGTASNNGWDSQFNTNAIYIMMTDTAHKTCWSSLNSDYTISLSAGKSCYEKAQDGGTGTWWLPSVKEMQLIFADRDRIGGFAASQYWTSNELLASKTTALAVNMTTGASVSVLKNVALPFRCARYMF